MLRTITLSLLMLVSVGITLPFASSKAHGIRQYSVARGRRHRRHSRAWWRHHRALIRRRHAALAHRNGPMVSPFIPQAASTALGSSAVPVALLPKLPSGWSSVPAKASNELRFKTAAPTGSAPGQASLSVVALSRPTPGFLSVREQRQLLGGVPFAELRRIVIDKMINAGGWVTNDYEREVGSCRVLVVSAHTPASSDGPEKAWNFYFTEMNGRIYSLTTNAPVSFSERMASEAEALIASLQAGATGSGSTPLR